MNLGRSIAASTATAALALGVLIGSSTASYAAIYFPVGPFGVVNSANHQKCEAVRRIYIADGILTKPCYRANGYYYFSAAYRG